MQSSTDAGTTPVANAVYTMTNAASGNAVLGFLRAADGSLSSMAAPFATGGIGTGSALGSQGAVAYDLVNNRLYAVNAGDNSFSIFPVKADGSLGTPVKVAANGDAGAAMLLGPKSITYFGNTVYVLFEGNATTASAIAGWTVTGTMATPIAGSMLPLSSATQGVDPAQVQFSPDGKWLVVTEKQSGAAGSVAGSGSIDTFAVDATGLAAKKGSYATASAGPDAGLQLTPYGFAFYGSYVIVSEAGSTGAGSYTYADGVIAPVAGSSQFLPTDPAPCWVAVAGDWAYVANAHGPDISGFTVSSTTGGLTNIGSAANAVVASTGESIATDAGPIFDGPTDEAVSFDGKFLYAVDSAVPAIGSFMVNADGSLTRVGTADFMVAALTAGVVGLAAR
jgi:6-phosphogluconolactonase (cycloisomerase 2 family)